MSYFVKKGNKYLKVFIGAKSVKYSLTENIHIAQEFNTAEDARIAIIRCGFINCKVVENKEG